MRNALLRFTGMKFPLIYLQIKINMYYKYLCGHTIVGTSHKYKNGPFQDLTQALYKCKNGPFQCRKPQASPANHKSVYFDQSLVSLF